jgi:NIPSNAP
MTRNAAGGDPAIARVLELRQYTLRPGQREILIDLFERELIEPQEAVGMQVLGQFRDLDRQDRFVWLRGFSDMEARRRGLAAFYGGPIWAAWGPAANATMIDSDDVLLLRPSGLASGLRPNVHPRPSPGASPDRSVLHATILTVDPTEAPMLAGRLSRVLEPVLAEAGHRLVGCYETDPTPNNFPRLPVRADTAFVWFTACATPDLTGRTAVSGDDIRAVAKALGQFGSLSWSHLRLAATSRSTLNGDAATVRTSWTPAETARWER